jgi:hypothetical protein
MSWPVLILFFFFSNFTFAVEMISIDNDLRRDVPWVKLDRSEERSMKLLISFLEESKVGASLVERARMKAATKGQLITDVVKGSDSSLTDTTLVRRFSPQRPDQVVYETESIVYLNRELHLVDAVLDLAHELTHYVFRRPFNPYQNKFHFKDFVSSTVEGKGGEVDAFLVECRVLDQLFKGPLRQKEKCDQIRASDGRYDKQMATAKFYQVGKQLSRFQVHMKKYGVTSEDFPYASSAKPEFISSAYGVPYPVAASEEYLNIMLRACDNDRKRLVLMNTRLSARQKGRAPANDYLPSLSKLLTSYEERCLSFTPPIKSPFLNKEAF